MLKILITGTGGFVASALALKLAETHEVVGLDIRPREINGVTTLVCDFSLEKDLEQLDPYTFDVCMHLAAVTGFGTEEEQLAANLMGTRRLLRYLITRSCKKFVLMSSIAAAGVLGDEFKPQALPLPEEHPCLALDGYGFSKYLMEELSRFISRQDPGLDIKVIRSCGIRPDGEPREHRCVTSSFQGLLAAVSPMYITDAVRWLTRAAEAPLRPGFRLVQSAGPKACVLDPVADVMRACYGEHAKTLDLKPYERPGHEFDPVLDTTGFMEEWGVKPEVAVVDIAR